MNENTIITMIQLRGTNLYIGSYIIPLHGRKRMLSLISYLIDKDRPVERHEIRKAIYKQPHERDLSFRLRDSQDCSLSKLISRSRRYLKFALADTPWSASIDWFIYEDRTKTWTFYQAKEQQILVEEALTPEKSGHLLKPEDVRVKTVVHQVKVLK